MRLDLAIDAPPYTAAAHRRGGKSTLPRQPRACNVASLDLLSAAEEETERWTRHPRFDIGLLANRLAAATDWIRRDDRTRSLTVGYFGASTGAAAAVVAAAQLPAQVQAVVSRGGRADLGGNRLPHVRCPTLLFVGGDDPMGRRGQ